LNSLQGSTLELNLSKLTQITDNAISPRDIADYPIKERKSFFLIVPEPLDLSLNISSAHWHPDQRSGAFLLNLN
jgi:hypothetical protein